MDHDLQQMGTFRAFAATYTSKTTARGVTVSDRNVTLRNQETINATPGACPPIPAGEALATRTALPPLASAPLSPLASLAPPATFGRPAQDTRDPRADVLDGRLPEQPAMIHAGCRPRALAVLLDDPAATALSLRTHMEPADLMELILILAEAAADVLRERDIPEKAVR